MQQLLELVTRYIQGRRRRYLAQMLGEFERSVEPHLNLNDPAVIGGVNEFKALVRMRLNALAVDAVDALKATLEGKSINQAGQDLRDRLHPEGRPQPTRRPDTA